MSRESIEIFNSLRDESTKYWIAVIVSPILSFFILGLSQASIFGVLISLLYVFVFIQSIRGILFIKRIREKLQNSPNQVNKSDVIQGPVILGIPGIQWFISLTR